ncbi:METTL5 family protein [Methanoplanus endosymbiosus]|uniref:Methyltransferase-like protein 5 n=1 Tax=Methanoplanus endosymbiosus TaxID=33865 RepID=A0A9E7PRK3_9EURY|nr:METTL5 family protein [Methanoplanus endosymbiosus]UUX93756.1 METTL5 family protein [Methanoplanus endosymbiosus]
MKLRKLEMILQGLKDFKNPDVFLEQYSTPAEVAARMLYHAYMKGDIEDLNILDLGCGTGVLSCGAALLDASEVTGIDTDSSALAIAKGNAEKLSLDISFIEADIQEVSCENFDTVIMNPPFGAQNKHADRPFIDKAVECAEITYGIFNEGSSGFVGSYLKGKAVVDEKIRCEFPMKRTFSHHKKDCVEIRVEILRIRRTEG